MKKFRYYSCEVNRGKGIIELIIACNELWEENYKFTLNLAGDIDKQKNLI